MTLTYSEEMKALVAGQQVAVIGLGKLGLPIACIAAQAGYDVIGVDVSAEVVGQLQQGRPHIQEPMVADMLRESLASGRLSFSTDYAAALDADIYFVVVPTPSDSLGRFSSRYVLEACAEIGKLLADRWLAEFPVVCIVSTVYPGAMANEIQPCLEFASGLEAGDNFGVFGIAYSPEFIALGSVVKDYINPDFVMVGASDEWTREIVSGFYRTVTINDPPILTMSVQSAEVAKLALNAYVTLKVSFANWLGLLCNQVAGASVDQVTRALGHDQRIGPRYFTAGAPFGGPCFPRDVTALGCWAQEQGDAPGAAIPTVLPWAIQDINTATLAWIESQVIKAGRVPLAILGLGYKTGCGLTEESPSVSLVRALRRRGEEWREVKVYGYDPYVAGPDEALRELGIAVTATAQAAINEAKTVVVMQPYVDFLHVALREGQTVVDCWRLFDEPFGDWAKRGINYVALGKGLQG